MQTLINVENELIPVKQIDVPKLFTDKKLVCGLIDAIEKKAKEHEPDISTKPGRNAIASNASKVAKSKTFLDGIRKDFVAARKAEIKVVDDIGKTIRDRLDAIRDEVRKPLTDFENAEKERLEKERLEAEFNRDYEAALHENGLIDRQREIERKEAALAKIEAGRIEKETQERIAKERAERDAKMAKEAEDRAKAEAEKAAKEAIEKAEREKHEAIEREIIEKQRAEQAERQAEIDKQNAIDEAKRQAEQAELRKQAAIAEAVEIERQRAIRDENERLAKEASVRAYAEKIAADKTHQKKINNEALDSFKSNGIECETAKKVIGLIAKGLICHIKIVY